MKTLEDCNVDEEDVDWTTNRPSDHNVKNMNKYNIRETVFGQVRFSETAGVTSRRESQLSEEIIEV